MNCKQAETLVAAYADDEVDALRSYSIRKHLLGCAGCTARQRSILALRAKIRGEVPYFVAPPALYARVRATLNDQLIEVASSDRHTVKPWLSARLDYSPPVQDLANEGFTLIGGRLDYLERRPIATLVYLYRKHTIDVFVRPETAPAPTSALHTVRGFNAARASGPSMDWLAVSYA